MAVFDNVDFSGGRWESSLRNRGVGWAFEGLCVHVTIRERKKIVDKLDW